MKLLKIVICSLIALYAAAMLWFSFFHGDFHVRLPVQTAVKQFCTGYQNPTLVLDKESPSSHMRFKCISNKKGWNHWESRHPDELVPVSSLDGFCEKEKPGAVAIYLGGEEVDCSTEKLPEGRFRF